jgi:integrase/recombinase XerD
MEAAENLPSFATQNSKAKLIRRIARLVRQDGLDYEGWRYVAKKVRQVCKLRPCKKGRKLPQVLSAEQFRAFYAEVDRIGNAQHGLLLRLLFYTAVRVSELVNMKVGDVDLDANKVRINDGKGGKDRYVLFGRTFGTALRTHLASRPRDGYLFASRQSPQYTTRRVEQIVSQYAKKAGISAHPHTFRHQAITFLMTRHSGLADAELQLITGHSRRETLAIYQHVALDGDLEKKYQQAMKEVEF